MFGGFWWDIWSVQIGIKIFILASQQTSWFGIKIRIKFLNLIKYLFDIQLTVKNSNVDFFKEIVKICPWGGVTLKKICLKKWMLFTFARAVGYKVTNPTNPRVGGGRGRGWIVFFKVTHWPVTSQLHSYFVLKFFKKFLPHIFHLITYPQKFPSSPPLPILFCLHVV